jgi:uncharacterized protein YdhG (YjbR/CyaY superfamily)
VAQNDQIDAYFATLAPDQREALQHLRALVRRVVPEAQETMSYGMPAFKLGGRFLISYAGWKRHCSIYPVTDTFLSAHAHELEGYDRTKGSLHFTPDDPLSDALVTALVQARVTELASGRR